MKIIGTIAGGKTLNPVVPGVVNGAGILETEWHWMTKIAFTTHEKVLVELRSALRGDEFNKNEFIKKLKSWMK